MSKIHILACNYIIKDYAVPTKEKIELLQECIELGVDINKNNSDMLFAAVNKCTDPEIFKFLIDNGINIHAENDIALYRVCMREKMRTKFEVVKLLLEAGAKINAYNSPIIFALTIYSEQYKLSENDIDIIKLLIEYGANPFEKTNQLFCRACYSGNVGFVKYLLDLGANCNSSEVGPKRNGSFHYNTSATAPICFAFEKIRGYSEDADKLGVIRLLLDNGANPNEIMTTTVCNGFTVIDIRHKISLLENTIINCDLDGCKLLFEYNADVNFCYNIINKQYKCFETLTMSAKQLKIMDTIMDLFMDHGLDIIEVIKCIRQWG